MDLAIDSVSVLFGFRHNISYAAKLSARLEVPLFVFVGSLSDGATKYRELFGFNLHDDPLARAKQNLNVLAEFISYDGSKESILHKLSPNTIFVSNTPENFRAQHVLAPLQEEDVFITDNSTILIPLGCDPTSVYTYKVGIPLARRLLGAGGRVVLYHTTWQNDSAPSSLAYDHMCDEAKRIISDAEAKSKESGLSTVVTLETAEDIVEGIVESALRFDSDLIIMARDPSTRFGDYCERLLMQPTPVPVLVLGENHEYERRIA